MSIDQGMYRSAAAREQLAEAALVLACRAFAQYALDTDEPSEQAVADFVEGFKQDAALRFHVETVAGHRLQP
jgi:hypothetical protein